MVYIINAEDSNKNFLVVAQTAKNALEEFLSVHPVTIPLTDLNISLLYEDDSRIRKDTEFEGNSYSFEVEDETGEIKVFYAIPEDTQHLVEMIADFEANGYKVRSVNIDTTDAVIIK